MIKKPLIHYITHPIVMTDCANAILAIGGSPIMAEHHAEVQDITAKSAALVVNLGNITDYRMQAMRLSAQVALAKGLPIILDLTGLGVSALRRTFAHDFITTFSPQLVKGNVSEILALLAFTTQANGVDTGDNHLTTEQLMKMRSFCQAHSCILLVTGEIDVIVDLGRFICLKNGSEKLTQVTGTGCLLSGMLGYFLSQSSDLETVDAVVKAVGLLTVASEVAEQKSTGLGSFKVVLFDYLSSLTPDQIQGKLWRFESQEAQAIVDFREGE
ncbi:hydroxyethylthiazole kinase [Pseudolactococcus yaeyamensis]